MFGVTFDPSAAGFRSSNIVIYDNTLGTQTQLRVQGTGVYPTTSLSIDGDTPSPSPISYDFGTAKVGTTINVTLTIKDISSVNLLFVQAGNAVTGIDPNDFTTASGVTDACSSAPELAAGGSCDVQLSFDPKAQGTRTATLHIGDNSPGGSEIINVSGTGK